MWGSSTIAQMLRWRFMTPTNSAFLRDLELSIDHPVVFARNNKYKKLSYRRRTARRAVSVETVRNVAQMFVELHLISPATGE